ncbi:folate-binding protein 1 [Salvia miltiorrhiza]|uniref:folate-binding protein 1 n=1 Tax=Salvia miltiorrhiza TaxID=226208 RepID=UPI0025AC5D92|nr:folate-binding protein 1 [Salvia miltiorrhiza]XP_057792254.1 folate-binding protein 1 [Salvia miltiorrhiza]
MRRLHHFCIFFFLNSINFWFLCAYGKTSEVCISPGGRFPPFSNVGKPPKKASKGPRDLTLCRVFRKKTCCDVTQTHPALLSIRRLASSGEASQECLQLWEFLECSICDPRVGVQRGPPNICASFCDRVYEACSTAYFAMDGKTQVLAPCGVGDFVCGRASEWVSNGTELCNAAGFSVKPLDDPEESSCYGGKGSLDYIANSWKSSRSEIVRREQKTEVVQDFMQLIADMPLSERISWAVGGMVLTAGLLFASRRKTTGQRQKQAAIQRTAIARRLGTRISPPASPVSHGNRKTVGK